MPHEPYMLRCLELAKNGAGFVAPNPMVGAVMVYNNRIIGEGYHKQYGHAHAEVNCLQSVQEEDRTLIPLSTMYVSLEPCAHFGKTPPCADRIIREGIRKVVIGCRDPFKEVDGKGIEKLEKAGVEVILGIGEEACKKLNKRFFTYYTKHRPYIVLKWAQTANKKIADNTGQRLFISNEYSNHEVHRWRSEEASILAGTNTILKDDPELTNRYWSGPSPVRLVIDFDLEVPVSARVLNGPVKTVVFNKIKHAEEGNLLYYQVTEEVNIIHQVVHALYQMKIQSVLVEGGARLLQSFIDEEMWDEARVITNQKLTVEEGLAAPALFQHTLVAEEVLLSDKIEYFQNLGDLPRNYKL